MKHQRILEFSIGVYPFTYLGVAICPTRLTSFWKHIHIFYVGKVILINSVLMSIPSYTLAADYLLDSILDQLSKIARNFLWHNDGNRSGLPLVSWNRATLDKFEGGISY